MINPTPSHMWMGAHLPSMNCHNPNIDTHPNLMDVPIHHTTVEPFNFILMLEFGRLLGSHSSNSNDQMVPFSAYRETFQNPNHPMISNLPCGSHSLVIQSLRMTKLFPIMTIIHIISSSKHCPN